MLNGILSLFNRRKVKGGIAQIEGVIGEFDSMRVRLEQGIEQANIETQASQMEIVALNEKITIEEQKQQALSNSVLRANKVIGNIRTFLAE